MTHIWRDPSEFGSRDRSSLPAMTDLRALYREQGDTTRRHGIRQGLWIAVVTYLLFCVTDVLLIPDVAPYTIVSRFAVGIAVLALMEAQVRMDASTSWMDKTCAIALVFGYLGWLVPALMTAERENLSHYLIYGSIFMMGANLFFSLQFRLSLLSSSIMLAASFAALVHFAPDDFAYQITLGTFFVSCFVFTSYVNWKLQEERFKVFVNALEAKNLQRETVERGKSLLRLSNTDYLTGLENRRSIDHRLREHWRQWHQDGQDFCILLIDVDFFKRYNDFYGHQRGDRCLIQVAEALNRIIQTHEGAIGRFGGEEFVVVAKAASEEKVARLAEELRQTVEQLELPHEERRDGLSIVTVSVGAAFTGTHAPSKLEKVIDQADRALYTAKADGRNAARVYNPASARARDVTENIAALLKIAVDKELATLVYQPIQDVRTTRIGAVEALMRLQMLDGSDIPPSLFIPVAERTGKIIELGNWAIRTACSELLAHNRVNMVSINVSPIQLKAPGFAASVASILVETGVSGKRLAFEITEGHDLDIHSDVLRCITDLRTLGIAIWLDDFGTGFAGLSWLRLIDFDLVKIDRSFLHASDTAEGYMMLQNIVRLIRDHGADILIEGIETPEQLELVRRLGISQAQGFHIGRPASMQQLKASLAAVEDAAAPPSRRPRASRLKVAQS